MAKSKLYHIPVLSKWDFGLFRSAGPGLGNLLLPIARALIQSVHTDGEFVYPTLRQVKIGTYLRNEPDKRTYGDVFRTRTFAENRKWLRSKTLKKISEENMHRISNEKAITYSGLRKYFHDIQGAEDIVSPWIKKNAILKGTHLDKYDIGVLVRLGDFSKKFVPNSPYKNQRIPIAWYDAAIKEAVDYSGVKNPKIVFFSDAKPEEIGDLMKKWNGSFNPGGNAITDMLNLSQARVAVASRSTFSMWAAYLGDSHLFWDSDYDHEIFFPKRGGKDRRVELIVDGVSHNTFL